MKKFLIVVTAALMFVACSKKETIINVSIDEPGDQLLLVMNIIGNKSVVDTLELDENNSAAHILPDTSLSDVTIVYGRLRILPEIQEQNQVEIKISKNGEETAVTFSGDNAAVNNYKYEREQELSYTFLQTLYKNEFNKLPFVAVSNKIDSIWSNWNTKLDAQNLVDKNFVEKEKTFFDNYFNHMKSSYAFMDRRYNKNTLDADADFVAFMADLKEHPEREGQNYYNYLFDRKVAWYVQLKWQDGGTERSYAIDQMETINEQITSESLRNTMLEDELYSYLSYSVDKNLEKIYALYKKLHTGEEQNTRLSELYQNAIKLMPGKPAPDFDMYTTDGEKVMLSDLRGKFVYIDVWATWCGPCVYEIPFMVDLHDALKDNKNIEIISISIDKDNDAWHKKLEEDKPQWKQYIVKEAFNSKLTTGYNIRGIPKFMLIGKDGEIIQTSANRPSNPNLLPMLKDLLK